MKIDSKYRHATVIYMKISMPIFKDKLINRR